MAPEFVNLRFVSKFKKNRFLDLLLKVIYKVVMHTGSSFIINLSEVMESVDLLDLGERWIVTVLPHIIIFKNSPLFLRLLSLHLTDMLADSF